MDINKKIINDLIKKIDFKKIKQHYKKLNFKKEYIIDKEIHYKVPDVDDIRDEFKALLAKFVYDKLNYLYENNWLIIKELSNIKVFFVLYDVSFNENDEYRRDVKALEILLKNAENDEEYEKAAKIRDIINKK